MALLIPPRGQIDVWITTTEHLTEQLHRTCKTLLSNDEQVRLSKFVAEDAKLQFLIARSLVRTTLSRYSHRQPDEWEFVANSYGRPRLADGQSASPLHFNISHTTGMVACIVSSSEEIGVDVENIDREVNIQGLAKIIFSSAENLRFASAGENEQNELFFQHWTLKEAYIKARGLGMSLPLKAFRFEFEREESDAQIAFSDELSDDPKRWRFKRFSPTKNHRLAIAASTLPDCSEIGVNLRIVNVAQLFDPVIPPLSHAKHDRTTTRYGF